MGNQSDALSWLHKRQACDPKQANHTLPLLNVNLKQSANKEKMVPADSYRQQQTLAKWFLFCDYSCPLKVPWPLLFSKSSSPAVSSMIFTLNILSVNCLLLKL